MRAVGKTVLAVAVIGGWLFALLGLSFGVAQMAVEKSTSVTCPDGTARPGGIECHR